MSINLNNQVAVADFTQPPPPFKCGGAPQKIMYLANDYFRKSGVREKTKIIYTSAAAVSFQVKKYADTLDKVIVRKGIETKYCYNLIEIKPEIYWHGMLKGRM